VYPRYPGLTLGRVDFLSGHDLTDFYGKLWRELKGGAEERRAKRESALGD
jgi:hypothetical protein